MAESQPTGPPWWRRHWLVLVLSGLGLIGLAAYAVLAARVLPAWIVSMDATKADENHRLDAIVNTRGALLGVLAPVVVAIGAVAAFLNYRVAATNLAETAAQNRRTVELSRDTLRVTERGQLTERFTQAIEQLGLTADDKLDIRLGGIYALEQIARDSPELHRPVMEILTAFLREHSWKPREASATMVGQGLPTIPSLKAYLEEGEQQASTQSDAASNEQAVPLRADFQAIATVLGRREVSHDPDGFRLDLHGVALGMVDFAGAHLQGAGFPGAQLQGATFQGAQLQEAIFLGAQLQGASFYGAELQEAGFYGAELQEAIFLSAQLQNANFVNADLEGAKFQHGETDEHDALGLTPEQFDLALNVDKALLPNYLAGALTWKQDGPSE